MIREEEESLLHVSKALTAWKEKSGETSGWRASRVYVLASYTLNGIEPFLRYHYAKTRLRCEPEFGLYGAFHQEVRNPSSRLYASEPEIVVVSQLLPALLPRGEGREWDPAEVWAPIEASLGALLERSRATIALHTFPLPYYAERRALSPLRTESARISSLNALVEGFAARHAGRVALLDFNQFLRALGREKCLDARFAYMSKAPFRPAFLSLFAQEVSRIAATLAGMQKKCLVLDCDNTLWGGVLGEEAIEDLHLDPDAYPGNVFYEFQRQALDLHRKGVLLAACSKNNESDVWEVMEKHPHSLLKKEHFVAFEISWGNKAEGIAKIAKKLNIGLDSMVFIDDSAYECDLVRQSLPDVEVFQVPAKIWELPELLPRQAPFHSLVTTEEDLRKSEMYRSESERQALRETAVDLPGFLRSLDLRVKIRRIGEGDVARVAQLTQKTNQFNLTMRRYADSEIAALRSDPDAFVYALSSEDRFGDMGLTNVFIARKTGPAEAEIDVFLMSCRVFERGIESAFLRHCLGELRSRHGVRAFTASFVPGKKNALVRDFWERCGFTVASRGADRVSYRLEGDARLEEASHIAILGEAS